jgi:hypothetical protein
MNVFGTMTKSLRGSMNVPGLNRSIVRSCAAGFQDGIRIWMLDGRLGIEQAEKFGKRHLAAATGS